MVVLAALTGIALVTLCVAVRLTAPPASPTDRQPERRRPDDDARTPKRPGLVALPGHQARAGSLGCEDSHLGNTVPRLELVPAGRMYLYRVADRHETPSDK
jgi:hypothetical protein